MESEKDKTISFTLRNSIVQHNFNVKRTCRPRTFKTWKEATCTVFAKIMFNTI